MLKGTMWVALVIGLILVATNSANANAFFLQIDSIAGESQDPQHMGWIEVTGFSMVLSPENRIIDIFKYVDIASPQIHVAVATGKVFSQALLDLTTSIGGQTFTYREFQMDDIMITAVRAINSVDLPEEVMELQSTTSPIRILDFAPVPEPGFTPVPEPSTLLFFCTGLSGLAAYGLSKRTKWRAGLQ